MKGGDSSADGANAIEVTLSSRTDNTHLNPNHEKKNHAETKVIKEHAMLAESVSEATPGVDKPMKLKTKKRKKESKIKAEESQPEGDCDTAQADEMALNCKTKKKKRKHISTEESVSSTNATAENYGEDTCEMSSCEISAELEPPKKKRKKSKKREVTVGEEVVSTVDSVGPMEVACEYINGISHPLECESAGSVTVEGGKKKGRKRREDEAVAVLEDKQDVEHSRKTKSKKHKKHKR